MVQINF